MALVKTLKFIDTHNTCLSDEGYMFVFTCKLLNVLANTREYQFTTVKNELNRIYPNISEFNFAFDIFITTQQITDKLGFTTDKDIFDASIIYSAFYKLNYQNSIPNSNEVLFALMQNIIQKKSHKDFVDSFISITNMGIDKISILSNQIFMSSIRALDLSKGVIWDINTFNYYCSRKVQHSFCKEHDQKTFHINEIVKLKNKDNMKAMYLGGQDNCNGNWLANPFGKK